MKRILISLFVALLLASCSLDFYPSDELNADMLLSDESGAEYIMDGCYALLKDEVEFIGYSSGNSYVKHFFQMAEAPADNTNLSGKTTSAIYQATTYMMTDNLKNVGTLWMVAYKIIYMTNTVIEHTPEGSNDQLLGEAYFMRGLIHFHLVTFFSRAYCYGTDNLGIPLMTATASPSRRASVGAVYDQIECDLQKASSLLGNSRGDNGYPSRNAALGLLSRLYLYMGRNTDVITTVNTMLGGKSITDVLVSTDDYTRTFADARTSPEVLFCVAHELTDNRNQASIGSMYNGVGGGWGEIYPSDPLLNLYERYPSDVRYSAFIQPQLADPADPTPCMVYFPDPTAVDTTVGRLCLSFPVTATADGYTFSADGDTYTVQTRLVNGEYTEYFVRYPDANGRLVDCAARILPKMQMRFGYPKYFSTKFSGQEGEPQLSSPVFLRWSEVILNRAEAYAKLGQTADALADVNAIRTRVGIPADGLFSAANMHGYTSVEDIVADERRMELAFEGHRFFDVFRNRHDLDRRYPGAQPWTVISHDDPRIQFPIPNAEWTVSHIEQNPGY